MILGLEFQYATRREPKLGRKSNRIHEQKLKNGERIFGQPLSDPEETRICGHYKRGTVLKGCTISNILGLNEFQFKNELITQREREIMAAVPHKRLNNNKDGPLVNVTNPHCIDLEQIKLFWSPQFEGRKPVRCRIIDLYLHAEAGRLKPSCDILEIDTGIRWYDVWLSHIYDIPHIINHLVETEPEIKEASLYICEGQHRFENQVVNQDFKNKIKLCDYKLDVKILDHYGGRYYVDLIDKNSSIFECLKDRHECFKKFCNLKPWLTNDIEPSVPFQEVQLMRPPRRFNNSSYINHRSTTTPFTHGGGTYGYFRSKLEAKNRNIPYPRERLFRVRMIRWSDPNSFSILPDDQGFLDAHSRFIKQLGNLDFIRDAEYCTYMEDKPFRRGELVLFKNEGGDRDLGEWCRGVVEYCYTYGIHMLPKRKTIEQARTNNFLELQEMLAKGHVELNELIYRVRSIDHGYRCTSSQGCMRHIQDMVAFKRFAPWSMRCKLFGIKPLTSDVHNEPIDGGYSTSCAREIDLWVRERKLDRNDLAAFYILHRCDLLDNRMLTENQFENPIPITLFHRMESIDQRSGLFRNKKYEFHCLNAHLVDQGFVEDTRKDGTSSNILLDDHFINVLAKHDKLSEI